MASARWGLWVPPSRRHVLPLTGEAENVELKVVVPDHHRRSLRLGRHRARVRRVYFLDTPDLALDRHGLIVRVRATDGRPDDTAVKLRPMTVDPAPKWLRRARNFEVEIDALPGHRVCSGSMKVRLGHGDVDRTLKNREPLASLLTSRQRRLIETYGPPSIAIGDLRALGPVEVRRYRFVPSALGAPLTVERWSYPDGSTLLELSTRCPVGHAADVGERLSALLRDYGIAPARSQRTKTDLTLRYFTGETGRATAA
ncbi:hypothetical protein [Actinoplanes sp. NPDC051851]|uniref:hypothetical protein n=1 Tax=Actinoplanes sp. NPDC051851 TaxID=3154753 RepID=UPI00342402BE